MKLFLKLMTITVLLGVITLITSGCNVTTLLGKVEYDDKKQEVKITSENGEVQKFSIKDTKSYVDDLLSTVSVPNGDNEQLKSFVYSKLDEMGIDLDRIDLNNDKEIKKVKKIIKKSLKKFGINPNDVNIDKFIEKLQEKQDSSENKESK